MTDHEKIFYIMQPELLELRADLGAEWVRKFCLSLIQRLDQHGELTARQRHTLDKTYDEAERTHRWVEACRHAPDPMHSFTVAMETMQANGHPPLPPHVAYAIRRGLGADALEAVG